MRVNVADIVEKSTPESHDRTSGGTRLTFAVTSIVTAVVAELRPTLLGRPSLRDETQAGSVAVGATWIGSALDHPTALALFGGLSVCNQRACCGERDKRENRKQFSHGRLLVGAATDPRLGGTATTDYAF